MDSDTGNSETNEEFLKFLFEQTPRTPELFIDLDVSSSNTLPSVSLEEEEELHRRSLIAVYEKEAGAADSKLNSSKTDDDEQQVLKFTLPVRKGRKNIQDLKSRSQSKSTNQQSVLLQSDQRQIFDSSKIQYKNYKNDESSLLQNNACEYKSSLDLKENGCQIIKISKFHDESCQTQERSGIKINDDQKASIYKQRTKRKRTEDSQLQKEFCHKAVFLEPLKKQLKDSLHEQSQINQNLISQSLPTQDEGCRNVLSLNLSASGSEDKNRTSSTFCYNQDHTLKKALFVRSIPFTHLEDVKRETWLKLREDKKDFHVRLNTNVIPSKYLLNTAVTSTVRNQNGQIFVDGIFQNPQLLAATEMQKKDEKTEKVSFLNSGRSGKVTHELQREPNKTFIVSDSHNKQCQTEISISSQNELNQTTLHASLENKSIFQENDQSSNSQKEYLQTTSSSKLPSEGLSKANRQNVFQNEKSQESISDFTVEKNKSSEYVEMRKATMLNNTILGIPMLSIGTDHPTSASAVATLRTFVRLETAPNICRLNLPTDSISFQNHNATQNYP